MEPQINQSLGKVFRVEGSRRNMYKARRRAVFLPIPGRDANSFTAFSNKADGYLILDKRIVFKVIDK